MLFKLSDPEKIAEIIEDRDSKAVAKFLQSEHCKKVFVMVGAGISTEAGIPDFRSPETGLYANLARLDLPFPEAVFEINFFRKNPLPFYTLAHELAPGRYRPTLTHSFIKLLSDKDLLHTHFTQNIDTLERRAGVPENKIVEAHGSFATSKCIDCKSSYPDSKMRQMIHDKEIPRCSRCKGLVKPDIVFFGESLPLAFHKSMTKLLQADLLLIIGTSLTVHPFASLKDLVLPHCPRVLINLEPAGGIGSRTNDIVLLGRSDQIIEDICNHLGWSNELHQLWQDTANTVDEGYREETLLEKPVNSLSEKFGILDIEEGSHDEKVDGNAPRTLREVANELSEHVEQSLNLSDEKYVSEAPDQNSKGSDEPCSEKAGDKEQTSFRTPFDAK